MRGIAAVAAVVFCRGRSGAVAADYRREFENCSQFRFAMIARILPPVKCGARNTPHLFIKVTCLSPLFASPVPVPPPKIPKEKRRHPRGGSAVFLELLMGFGSRLRARSSAALTGLAAARSRSGSDRSRLRARSRSGSDRSRLRARSRSGSDRSRLRARSRSGSDSPPDCHSLPSRRFATPDCHSPPSRRFATPDCHSLPSRRFATPDCHSLPSRRFATPDCHSPPSRRFATPDCHSLRSYPLCVSTGVSRGNATTNKPHLRPKCNVRGALPPPNPIYIKRRHPRGGGVPSFWSC